MSYSKSLIREVTVTSTKTQEPTLGQTQPTNVPASPLEADRFQVSGLGAAGADALTKTVRNIGSDLFGKDGTFTKPKNIAIAASIPLGIGVLGAIGKRIGNIGSKKDKKKLNEKSKKDDLYYRQVDFDPYAPRYTVPQLATTAGGITGTTAGSIYGSKVGTALGGSVGGLLGAGIGGALGGAAGSIGAYQLAKMARPKKKKKLVQYYR